MRTYIVHVNGQRYEVTVEEKTESPEVGKAAMVPAASASKEGKPAPVTETAPPVTPRPERETAAPGTVTAPLPGSITAVKVHPGSVVKEKQVLLVLEAMKMENEIVAPVAGTVKEVYVQEGDKVNAGDPLASIV